MYLEIMDARSKYVKPECQLSKTGAELRWRVLGSTEVGRICQATAGRATIRQYFHREQKRAKRHAKVKGHVDKKWKSEVAGEDTTPRGAMAPKNTTQYLMSNVYEDMKTSNTESSLAPNETCAHVYSESMSPRSVYTALDSAFYESCLAFQQKEFDQVFDLS